MVIQRLKTHIHDKENALLERISPHCGVCLLAHFAECRRRRHHILYSVSTVVERGVNIQEFGILLKGFRIIFGNNMSRLQRVQK